MMNSQPFSYAGQNASHFDRSFLWHYRASPVRVIDGDTIVVLADTGFDGRHEVRVRIQGLWAPEMLGFHVIPVGLRMLDPGAQEAKDALSAALSRIDMEPWPIKIVTLQRKTIVSEVRSMERWVGDVYISTNGILENIIDVILKGLNHGEEAGRDHQVNQEQPA
jgi:endonuclease YncB( thermonuclease family)